MSTRRAWIWRIGATVSLALAAQALPQTPGQLNTEVYGNGVGSVRQSGMAGLGNQPWDMGSLGSEWQHNAFLSGQLRSEIRGEYLLKGPLAPGGLSAYVPPAPTPYGSARPYSTPPRTVAGVPAAPMVHNVAPRQPAGTLGSPVPLGLTSPIPAGTLRPGPARLPAPSAAPAALPSAVKPPLIQGGSGGSIRHAATYEPESREPALVIPPRVDPDADRLKKDK